MQGVTTYLLAKNSNHHHGSEKVERLRPICVMVAMKDRLAQRFIKMVALHKDPIKLYGV